MYILSLSNILFYLVLVDALTTKHDTEVKTINDILGVNGKLVNLYSITY